MLQAWQEELELVFFFGAITGEPERVWAPQSQDYVVGSEEP